MYSNSKWILVDPNMDPDMDSTGSNMDSNGFLQVPLDPNMFPWLF